MQKLTLCILLTILSLTSISQISKTLITDRQDSITLLRTKADILLRSHIKLQSCVKEVELLKKAETLYQEQVDSMNVMIDRANTRAKLNRDNYDLETLRNAKLQDDISQLNTQLSECNTAAIKQRHTLKSRLVTTKIVAAALIGGLTYLFLKK